MKITRVLDGPMIGPDTPTSGVGRQIGVNINGPSLIRAPEWLPDPIGSYLLYFPGPARGAVDQGHHVR